MVLKSNVFSICVQAGMCGRSWCPLSGLQRNPHPTPGRGESNFFNKTNPRPRRAETASDIRLVQGLVFYLRISAPQSPRWGWTNPDSAGTPRCSPPPIPPRPLLPQPSHPHRATRMPRPDSPGPLEPFGHRKRTENAGSTAPVVARPPA